MIDKLYTPLLKAVLICVVLAFVDTVLGVFIAMKNGNLDVRQLPRFIQTQIFPYVGGLFILAVSAGADDSGTLLGITGAAIATYGAKLLADIKDKLVALFS